ncbi:hypothetical protein HS088_TW02G00146 [Tripterygium wilfordii]|uniref:Uncharacterized protein n=1 Tax=Tripterygium wilfordii TaxID=458696 RepID=A0A7J7DYI4_TRIWF|nr:hypothetical protein HS088_TW02G00146 [Tripterygium wilfordii]
MSAVVEVWVSELARLKERVEKVKKPLLLSLSKDKAKEAEEEVEDIKIKAKEKEDDSATISETTVFLLMDMFAPL